MHKFTKKQYLVAGVAAVIVAAGTRTALAYWTTSGSGAGSGATTGGTSDQLAFEQTALTSMYPGDSAQTLTVKVINSASEKAYVSTVNAYITTDKTGCTGADFMLGRSVAPSTGLTAAALTWNAQDLAKLGGNANASSTVQFNNTSADQDACKSAAVTINYLAS
jgi:hypothetical protein